MTLEVLNIFKNKSSEPVFVFRYQFGAENHVILHPSIEKLKKFLDIYEILYMLQFFCWYQEKIVK